MPRSFTLVAFSIGLLLAPSIQAAVTLPAIFSEHAVLQGADKVPVWGKATAGEKVTVTLDKASSAAVAGPDGKWRALLDLRSVGPGPFDLVVQGQNVVTVKDVVVGQVWACTGQSNMAFPLMAFPVAKEEVPRSANPMLRQFLVTFKTSPVPLDEAEGKWTVAGPQTSGVFTAVGYFFGKQLQKELGAPVGLINDCVGGTVIETWMSQEALSADPELKAGAEKAQKDRAAFDGYAAQYLAWQKKYHREDHPTADPAAFYGPGVDTRGWKPVTLPGLFATAGLPDAGAVWLRRKIPVPSPPDLGANRGIDMRLGDIHDMAKVWWNTRQVGSSDVLTIDQKFGVRFNFVTEGEADLSVRIFCPSTGMGLTKSKNYFSLNHYQLSGEWLAKTEFELPPLDAEARAALPVRPTPPIDPQNVAAYLYNGMINPVIPYGIAGFIWYQGEGNWDRGFQYRTEFPLLIRDWRARWGRGDLPFYFCQIANYMGHDPKPGDSPYAEVRDAQTLALSVPNTGEAILIDIGEEGNIHPADKPSVGDRLARIALAKTYGRKVVFSGPVYEGMTVEGDKARVRFQHAEGGLVAKPLPATYQPLSTDPKTVPLVRNSPGEEVEGFAICGEDHKWKWADAKIDGGAVLVWSPEVAKPVAVRYAWAQNPWCNLYNGAGLPAGPFRTDDFPLTSLKKRY